MSWPDDVLDIRIRIALDADRTVDWTTWDWEDISEYGREAGRIAIGVGDADEFGDTPPANCALRLDNIDGRFTRRNPTGPYYGRFGRNTPIWIEVDPGTGYETRFFGEVIEWPKNWDVSATDSTVPIDCAGISRRLGQNDALATSALTGYLPSTGPVAWWPLEDGEASTYARSGLVGGQPMAVRRGVMDFVDEAPPGASGSAHPDPSAVNALIGTIDGVSSSEWHVSIWVKADPENASDSAYIIPWGIRTTTGKILRLVFQKGFAEGIGVGLWDSEDQDDETHLVSTADTGITGEWVHITFSAQQSGGDVNVYLNVDEVEVNSAVWSSSTIGAPIRVNVTEAFTAELSSVSDNIGDIYLTQLTFHNGVSLVTQQQAGLGFPGEGAADRIIRLFTQAGVPITVIGAALGEPMAAQGAGTLMALARACEAADGGTLQDNPAEPGMLYIPREERYNLTPWELDVDDADIGDAPEATDDDQRTGNQVTATRPGGGSYVARAQADIDAYGIVVDDPISPEVWQDTQLPHQAGWRLHLDQVDEDRWPRLPLNFARRPELIADWVNVLPGETRARIANMPGQTEPVDVIIEGWTETISQVEWRADLFCSPASPWTVGVVEDDVLGRADTDGSKWAADVDAGTDTSALVVVTDGPTWINSADHSAMLPVEIRSSGAVLNVTGIDRPVRDTFSRTVSAGSWGSATSGQAWTIDAGTPANFSVVSGTTGRIALTSTNDLHMATLDTGCTDHDPIYRLALPVVPTGAAFVFWCAARFVDSANYYYATLAVNTTALVDLRLFRRVANTATQLGSTVTLSPVHTASALWLLQCSATGSRIRVRAWREDQPAALGWHITEIDTNLTGGTRVAIGARRETGNTSGSTNVDFDNLDVACLRTFTFDAVPVNGVTKTIPASTPLSLAHPWRLAL